MSDVLTREEILASGVDKTELLPWKQGILVDWDIVGMNHYHVDGERRIFVAMTQGGSCIRAEGADEDAVFAVLAMAAQVHAGSTSALNEMSLGIKRSG